jgi:hypothetical protein
MPDITLDDIRAAVHVLKAKYDDMVADAIAAELVPLEELYDTNINERATAAKDAVMALDKPQAELSELLREIERTEGKCSGGRRKRLTRQLSFVWKHTAGSVTGQTSWNASRRNGTDWSRI